MKVSFELCIEISNKANYFAIWLRQLGPNGFNENVNTKYRIYADKDGKIVEISRWVYFVCFKRILILGQHIILRIKKGWDILWF